MVSLREKEEINLQEIIAPDNDLQVLKGELKTTVERISSIDNLLRENTGYRKDFLNYLTALKKSLVFNKVKSRSFIKSKMGYNFELISTYECI